MLTKVFIQVMVSLSAESFQCLKNVSPLIQEASSVLTNQRELQAFKPCVGVSLQSVSSEFQRR